MPKVGELDLGEEEEREAQVWNYGHGSRQITM